MFPKHRDADYFFRLSLLIIIWMKMIPMKLCAVYFVIYWFVKNGDFIIFPKHSDERYF